MPVGEQPNAPEHNEPRSPPRPQLLVVVDTKKVLRELWRYKFLAVTALLSTTGALWCLWGAGRRALWAQWVTAQVIASCGAYVMAIAITGLFRRGLPVSKKGSRASELRKGSASTGFAD